MDDSVTVDSPYRKNISRPVIYWRWGIRDTTIKKEQHLYFRGTRNPFLQLFHCGFPSGLWAYRSNNTGGTTVSPGKGELGATGKGVLSLSCWTHTDYAKENIAGIFLALLWKMDPAGSHEWASNPIRVRNAKEKYPGKVSSGSYTAQSIVHSRAQPIIKMKGMFPSNLPSGGMVNIPSWLQPPDWSNATHFLRKDRFKKYTHLTLIS